MIYVALLAEGVDRNPWLYHFGLCFAVALLAEGVDRNFILGVALCIDLLSPSSRRAWIEIYWASTSTVPTPVALLAEGVDRNPSWNPCR